jgi:hypothetical protein
MQPKTIIATLLAAAFLKEPVKNPRMMLNYN